MQDYVLGEREGEVGILVKAGLHEVDLLKRRMQPCYWPGTFHRVIRGSWYVDKGSGYAPLKVGDCNYPQPTHKAKHGCINKLQLAFPLEASHYLRMQGACKGKCRMKV